MKVICSDSDSDNIKVICSDITHQSESSDSGKDEKSEIDNERERGRDRAQKGRSSNF